ncbi:hypothetical protein [Niabella hibiscisoli]|uniref:hypothetical protein n=1 Tax=Niabella hibiscisoli TaxID=1825928 RepID=UPI001F111AEE|nr:hypothetical protein [Niabella hibiscisoli]MCH5718185.1 hypothetical protein [Niabella hibiscisoli]
MNNKIKTLLVLLIVPVFLRAQTHTDQNGWKTSVTDPLSGQPTSARRFEVATLGYNSHHWQMGGLIFVELFNQYFATGYMKYVVENGYGQGAGGGAPVLRLLETYGTQRDARVVLGVADSVTAFNGVFQIMKLPIYVDVGNYGSYKVKITYLQDKVDALTGQNQLKFNVAPAGDVVGAFTGPAAPDNNIAGSGNLMISGLGAHYIENGNVGIGTKNPTERLSVKGKIRAQEIKVEAANTGNWPDYVFTKEYQLPSLADVEKHIKEKGHLPEVPSAKEVEKEGIALGANQALLLKKIEELTLYILELNKTVSGLKEKVLELESVPKQQK